MADREIVPIEQLGGQMPREAAAGGCRAALVTLERGIENGAERARRPPAS